MSARALLVAILSLSAVTAPGAQSTSQPTEAPSLTERVLVTAPSAAPTSVQSVTNLGELPSQPATAVRDHRSEPLSARAAGLTTRSTERRNGELPLPAPRQDNGSSRTNTALLIVGAAAIVLGAAVGDEAGTVLIIGGAGIGLYGLYRLLN
ncbi:MAG: hypothetical protein ABIW79_09245 [Gemmatimonas sp.]